MDKLNISNQREHWIQQLIKKYNKNLILGPYAILFFPLKFWITFNSNIKY